MHKSVYYLSISAKSPLWKVSSCHISHFFTVYDITMFRGNPMIPYPKICGNRDTTTPGLTPMDREGDKDRHTQKVNKETKGRKRRREIQREGRGREVIDQLTRVGAFDMPG